MIYLFPVSFCFADKAILLSSLYSSGFIISQRTIVITAPTIICNGKRINGDNGNSDTRYAI